MLTKKMVWEHANNYAVYNRGLDYYLRNKIIDSAISEYGKCTCYVARVKGTSEYITKIWFENGELKSECSCPMGKQGAVCKHVVAVGLDAENKGTVFKGKYCVIIEYKNTAARAIIWKHDQKDAEEYAFARSGEPNVKDVYLLKLIGSVEVTKAIKHID